MNALTTAKSYVTNTVVEQRPSKWLKPSRLFWVLIIAAVMLIVLTAVINGNSLNWLFESKAPNPEPIEDVAKVLAPLLALALVIERLIETLFDFFEQSIEEVAELGSAGESGLKWLQSELNRAWQAANEAASKLGNGGNDEAILKELTTAEERIAWANKHLAELTKDPRYVATKRLLSIWLALFLGLVVAVMSDTGIFALLQIQVPRVFDMLVTGFVIGAGSGPTHSLIGILQGAKNALAKLGELDTLRPIK